MRSDGETFPPFFAMRVGEVKVIKWLLKMTAEMTADYIMIIWLVEMTAEITADRL